MADYIFMTDSDSDLPFSLKQKYDIPVVYMPYAVDGKEYFDDLGQTMDHKTYFDKMREGATPTTSALNEAAYMEYFEPILKEKDLLFVAFSSQLSCTIQAIYAAREELLKQYPERKFIVVDTLSISAPMTLLVLKAHEMYRAGQPIEAVAQRLEDNKLRAQAWFTVDDLKYLKRGGRISSTAAAVGTLLNIKPILHLTTGKLDSYKKARGMNKACETMLESIRSDLAIRFQEAHARGDVHLLAAGSADPLTTAKWLKQIEAAFPGMPILYDDLSMGVSCHTGEGALGIGLSVRPQV